MLRITPLPQGPAAVMPEASMRPQRNAADNSGRVDHVDAIPDASMRPQRNAADNIVCGALPDQLSMLLQ